MEQFETEKQTETNSENVEKNNSQQAHAEPQSKGKWGGSLL